MVPDAVVLLRAVKADCRQPKSLNPLTSYLGIFLVNA